MSSNTQYSLIPASARFTKAIVMMVLFVLFATLLPSVNGATQAVSVGEWKTLDNLNDTYIAEIKAFSNYNNLTKPASAASRAACVGHPKGRQTIETRLDRSGTWKKNWEQASGCQYCQKGTGGAVTFGIERTTGWSASGGLGISFGDIKSVLPNPTLGFEYTDTVTVSTSSQCNCVHQRACVWTQQRMIWSDISQRTHTIIATCDGEYDGYGDWQAGHSDVPVKGPKGFNWGCSTGSGCNC